MTTKNTISLATEGPSRTYTLGCGDGGPQLCKVCNIIAVVNCSLESTHDEEPKLTKIGQKCMWCDWRELA